MIYASTKFEVATSIGLGEDTITRNVTEGRTDRQTDRRTDRLWYEINIPYFSNKKAGIISNVTELIRPVNHITGKFKQPIKSEI